MFVLLLSCAFSLGTGQKLTIVCDGRCNKASSTDGPLPLIRECMICLSFCRSERKCGVIPSWLALICPNNEKATTRPFRSMIGKRCNTSQMCTAHHKDTDCIEGKCLCKPGLSLDRNDRCVRSCKKYGTSFTSYKGLSTTGHNTKVLPFVKFGRCKRECIEQIKFECVSVEMGHKLGMPECHLGKDSFLDVPETDRCFGNDDYTISTRNCQGAKIIR